MTKDEEIDSLQRENNKLRGIIAYSDVPCLYCRLPKVDMLKCEKGFPGCGRADDMVELL